MLHAPSPNCQDAIFYAFPAQFIDRRLYAEIDLLPGFVCFFVGLLYELEMGIFTGVGTHLVIVLYNSARPRVRVDIKQVMIENGLVFRILLEK